MGSVIFYNPMLSLEADAPVIVAKFEGDGFFLDTEDGDALDLISFFKVFIIDKCDAPLRVLRPKNAFQFELRPHFAVRKSLSLNLTGT